jgi:hypothetical protein
MMIKAGSGRRAALLRRPELNMATIVMQPFQGRP